jgi:O-antigen/teichoic acid export membrane protein
MAETSSNQSLHLLSGRLLARNALWNLLGGGAPLLVAVFSIPLLIRELGKERFGVLALVWALIGYAGVFDLGVGRALTQLVAKKLGAGEQRELPSLARTSLLLMLALGLVGAVAVILISPWLVRHALQVPARFQSETVRSFYLLGLSLPLVIITAGLRGVLEAHQRFALSNALRIPMGVFTFLGPMLVLPFSRSLVPIVAILLLGRLLGCGAYLWSCLKVIPAMAERCPLDGSYILVLLRFGGWMTVTNLVSPLMITLDRFLIGGLLSIAAVTYYVTPFEVVTKLLLVPVALMGVVFPAFSTARAQDRASAALLFDRSIRCVSMALFPIVLLIVVFAHDGLNLWLGTEFAQHSTRVLQWLGIGVFINGLSCIPFAFLQGLGRPELTAKLSLIELPLYLLTVWSLTKHRGVEGTAIAWTLRMAVDAALLFWLSARVAPEAASGVRRTGVMVSAATAVLSLAMVLPGFESKITFLVLALAGFAAVAWRPIARSAGWLLAQRTLKASQLFP